MEGIWRNWRGLGIPIGQVTMGLNKPDIDKAGETVKQLEERPKGS